MDRHRKDTGYEVMAKLIWDFISNLHLTLTEWAIAALAAVVGAFVVAFKVQGSRLHAAQVQLLLMRYSVTNGRDSDRINAAKAVMNKAIKAYEDANRSDT